MNLLTLTSIGEILHRKCREWVLSRRIVPKAHGNSCADQQITRTHLGCSMTHKFHFLPYSDCQHHNHFGIFPARIDFPPLKPFSESDYFKALAAVSASTGPLFAFRTSLGSSFMYLVISRCQREHHCSCRRTAESESSKAKWLSENEHKRTLNSTWHCRWHF